MAGKRAVRLRKVDDVTRLLANTINKVLRSEIEDGKASKIGYLANILLRALESSDIESRVNRLEKAAKKIVTNR